MRPIVLLSMLAFGPASQAGDTPAAAKEISTPASTTLVKPSSWPCASGVTPSAWSGQLGLSEVRFGERVELGVLLHEPLTYGGRFAMDSANLELAVSKAKEHPNRRILLERMSPKGEEPSQWRVFTGQPDSSCKQMDLLRAVIPR